MHRNHDSKLRLTKRRVLFPSLRAAVAMTDKLQYMNTHSSHLPNIDSSLLRKLDGMLRPVFLSLMSQEKIPVAPTDIKRLKRFYIPFCSWIAKQHKDKPLLIGLNGAQGSGKTTLTKLLCEILNTGFGKKTLHLGLDDFYLSKQQRSSLATRIHPLLKTRGVPGTHNIELAQTIIDHLLNSDNSTVLMPQFDKASDDVIDTSQHTKVRSDYNIIIFEGWCVGTPAEESRALLTSTNQLEEKHDKDGTWRRYVNAQLATGYKSLFSLINIQIYLQIPDFNMIKQWRQLQEEKLKAKNTEASDNTMSSNEIDLFIMHFERLTRFNANIMPDLADVVLKIDDTHQVSDIMFKSESNSL